MQRKPKAMQRTPFIRRFARYSTSTSTLVLVPLYALAPLGCTSSHGPTMADTNTSWLSTCGSNRDCGAGASCIDSVCTLSCDGAAAQRTCQPLGPGATCEEQAGSCDLPCTEDSECHTLSSHLRCESGRCREPSALRVGSQALQLAADMVPRKLQFTAMDAAWRVDRWQLVISADNRGQDLQADGSPVFTSTLSIIDVFPDGHVETTAARDESSTGAGAVVLGLDGRVQETMYRPTQTGELASCELRFYESPALDQFHTVPVNCNAKPEVTSLNETGAWLLISKRGGAHETQVRFYDAAQQLVGSEQLLAVTNHGVVQAQASGERSVILHRRDFGLYAGIALLPADETLTTLLPVESWRDVSRDRLPKALDGGTPGWKLGAGGWLLPYGFGSAVVSRDGTSHAVVVRPNIGSELEPTQVVLDLSVGEERSRLDSAHSLYPIPERNLLAYTHVETPSASSDDWTLWLHLFDLEGHLQTAPVRIASSALDILDCKLFWSGEAFLVTWKGSTSEDGDLPWARVVHLPPALSAP